MNIYLAAPYTDKAKLAMLRLDSQLTVLGHEVVSSWYAVERARTLAATVNVDELHTADTIVVDTTLGVSTGGGMWGELGFAIALGKWPLVICKDAEPHVWCAYTSVWTGPHHEWLLGILHNYATVRA